MKINRKTRRKALSGKLNCSKGNKQCGMRCVPKDFKCTVKEAYRGVSNLTQYPPDPIAGKKFRKGHKSFRSEYKSIRKNKRRFKNLDRRFGIESAD